MLKVDSYINDTSQIHQSQEYITYKRITRETQTSIKVFLKLSHGLVVRTGRSENFTQPLGQCK